MIFSLWERTENWKWKKSSMPNWSSCTGHLKPWSSGLERRIKKPVSFFLLRSLLSLPFSSLSQVEPWLTCTQNYLTLSQISRACFSRLYLFLGEQSSFTSFNEMNVMPWYANTTPGFGFKPWNEPVLYIWRLRVEWGRDWAVLFLPPACIKNVFFLIKYWLWLVI